MQNADYSLFELQLGSFSHKKPGIAPYPVRKVEEALRTLFG